MSDFSDAYKVGLGIAQEADRVRKEIDGVFQDLGNQILNETDHRVYIERRAYRQKPPLDDMDPIAAFLATASTTFMPSYLVVAYNPHLGKDKEKKLAYWEMDRAGYPCRLEWGNQHNICEDKNGLVSALVALLKDPVVAEKIYQLAKIEPNPT